MDEAGNKSIMLIIGIMLIVAVVGVTLVLFLNKDYQSALAEEPVASLNQQANEMDNTIAEKPISQKIAGKSDSTIDACVDFDNGNNYYVKGIARIGNNPKFNEDYCLGNRLSEFYCNQAGDISEEFYICPNGCEDGARIDVDLG